MIAAPGPESSRTVGGAPVRVDRLAFAYPDGTQVLYGVDLEVGAGERVAVLGPNGSGKTTLLLRRAGVLGDARGGTSAGRVLVDGEPLDHLAPFATRRAVGLVMQEPDDQLFSPTVRDDVAFGPRNLGLRGAALDGAVDAALATVGMADAADRPPYHLSFGQRRRVAVATVLAMSPRVLVLDEPTSNLDPAARRELIDTLAALPATLVIATHDLPLALELCPRVVILDDGQIVADGPTRELLADEALLRAHRLELPFGFRP